MGAFRFAAFAAALLVATPVGAQTVSTYAGTGSTAYNGEGTATSANLNFPHGLAVDSAGNVYVADSSHHLVRKITPGNVISIFAGVANTSGTALTHLNIPTGVAIDSADNIYIADTFNHRILRFAAGSSTATLFAGTGSSGAGADGVAATTSALNQPFAIAVDSAGDVYFTDTFNHRVRKVSGGIVTTILGSGAPGCSASQLNNPRGIAVAANGDVYVADTLGHNIRRLSGGVATFFAGSDFNTGCTTGSANGTGTAARFSGPNGLAFTENGDLLVADAGNHRVRRIRGNVVSTIAGTTSGFSGNPGPAATAQFQQPIALARGPAGTYAYYVSDYFNHRVRKVVPGAPAAPTLDSATAGNGQATLAFSHTNDGGAPVTGFTASCTPGPVTQGGTSSPIVVTGLTNSSSYSCSVTATNMVGTSTASNALTVEPGVPPSITSAAPPGGTFGVAYSHTYTATGTPAPTFAVTANALPGGLALSPSGAVTGVPNAAGLFTGTVTASNGVLPASTQNFSITIAQATQAITFDPLPDRVLGTGPFTLTATGGASGNPVTFASSTTGVCTTTGTNGATLTLVAAGTCTIAADQAGNANYTAAPQVQRSFNVTVLSPGLQLAAASLDFGGQSMGTTSPVRSVTVTNTGQAALTISSLSAPNTQFTHSHTCSNIAPGGTCAITGTFTPAPTGAAFNSSTAVSTQLTIASNAAGSPHTLQLQGLAEKSLVTHYYRSILRRDPDTGGKAFWGAEAQRVADRGANVNEAWFAMAAAFYFSAEYAALNANPTQFVTDLYNTFFNRTPDSGGLAFWVANINQGMPREVVLVSFMFSIEFANFTQAIFGNTAARAEVDAVMDFYRGLLARLPDNGGFDFWVARFRTAQCQGAAAVSAEAEAISSLFALSAEYTGRNRTNAQYVGDLYNAFLRRAGDLQGVQFWIAQLDSGALGREQVRVEFRSSPEFGARVGAIINAGCQP